MRPRFASLAVTVALLVAFDLSLQLASATTAHAQPAQTAVAPTDGAARARLRFETGQLLASQSRWEEAYAEFEAGYALSPRPLFLFNMAECAREAGRTSQARVDYARYLEAEPQGSQSDLARERLAILGPEPTPLPTPVVTLPAPDLTTAGTPRPLELWEDWPFWTVLGVVVVGAAVGIGVGVAVTDASNPCGAGCVRIDWRN